MPARAGGSGAPAAAPRRAVYLLGALALAVLALAVLNVASSRAATIQVPGATFNRTTVTSGRADGIAVDEASGSVYVLTYSGSDSGAIEKLDASGAPVNFSATGTNVIRAGCSYYCTQIAVDNSGGPNQGVIYVSERYYFETKVEVFLPSGEHVANITARSQFEFDVAPCGVAVDQDGNVIVTHGEGSPAYSSIDKLELGSWAEHPDQVPTVVGTIGPEFTEACKTVLDSSGRMYVLTGREPYSTGHVQKFEPNLFGEPDPSGKEMPAYLERPSTTVDSGPDAGLAVDGEDNLYVVRSGGPVRKIDPSGSLIATFGGGEMVEPWAIAIDKTTGKVFVVDRSESAGATDVHVFSSEIVPDSLTGGFSAETQTSGTLSGEADPAGGGSVTGCQFEYVPQKKFNVSEFAEASTVFCQQATPFAAKESVSAPVSGLTLEEPYYFRLRTENANGPSNGTIHTFVPHAVIGLGTKEATSVAPRSATLNASFIGNGESTEYFFEYGTTKGLGTKTEPESSSPPGPGTTGIAAPIAELEPETTYYYRVVAENGTGKSVGEDMSFTTPPAVAGVTTKAASDIALAGATLNGEFTGNGEDTSYYFEYGLTKNYGMVSEELDAGSASGATPVSATISKFEGYSTYHYRLVAVNGLGTTYGADETFESGETPPPAILGSGYSGLTPTSVTLSANVNPNRWPTEYLFEWGPSPAYGSATTLEAVISGLDIEGHQVSAPIGGLTPATVYHYRVVAINFAGVTNGPDQTFATPDAPRVEGVSVQAVTETSAHLRALVAANSSPTSVRFEFGTSPAYGAAVAGSPIATDLIAHETAADLTGLAPGTTYHFRVVAQNGIGATTGADLTFTTAPAPTSSTEGPKRVHCPKHKVKRHGKCVKKKAHKHRKAHKHKKHKHKRKHKSKHRHGKRHG